MCGICGYIGPKPIADEALWKMNNTMYHRGPNDGGIWQCMEDGGNRAIGLAQRRLSILDLSELGHQPMESPDERYVIVYNGEIYNFQAIRKELEAAGYTFRSNCDTEVVLYAYAKWNTACFSRFNGMFAIAIYDRTERRLVLARDRIGKKPLYYYHHNGCFAFGSELKPIMAYPYFEKRVNQDVIAQYLCNKYLVAPFCIFQYTYKLEPGTIIEFQGDRITKSAYWNVTRQYKTLCTDMEENYHSCMKRIDDLLQDAVASRLIADVPTGTFLSGGIDSTLVTAVAQKSLDHPINTYSIGFYDKERNEASYSEEIAKFIGTNHHVHYVDEQDVLNLIEDLPRYYDEPFADSSQLPTMLVSEYAAKDVTVTLSGDGGDEVFCGYKMYDQIWMAQRTDWCGAIASHIPGKEHWLKQVPPELRALILNRDAHTKTQLDSDMKMEEVEKLLGRAGTDVKFTQETNLDMKNWQVRRMLLDMQTYLPDEILAKVDRASMKYSLETRCPLLDYRIIEESFHIPHRYKYARFDKKHILKDITYRYVPRELLDRPKKGFGVPLRKWLRTVLKDEIRRYMEPAKLRRQGIFNPIAVQELIAAQEKSDKIIYSNILWSLYVFQKWYQMYIEDLW